MTNQKASPVCVLISDVHYSLPTYELADIAFRQAIDKAAALQVPLVDAGDLTNDKAIIRGEVMNTLLRTRDYAEDKGVDIYSLVGNHSLINEKGSAHTLAFLSSPRWSVVQSPVYVPTLESWLVPYQTDPEVLRAFLKGLPEGARLIMHQGVQTAYLGHYPQDKTSLTTDDFANFRVISGHYHRRQDIKCGRPRHGAVGLFSYIGNPYTLTFGEASDPEKGFQVLMSDGLLEFVPTNLRSHIVLDFHLEELQYDFGTFDEGDLIWVKVRGSKSELDKLSKHDLGDKLRIGYNFKLDKIPYESEAPTPASKPKDLTEAEVLDTLIDGMSETDARKVYLKSLWREITE